LVNKDFLVEIGAFAVVGERSRAALHSRSIRRLATSGQKRRFIKFGRASFGRAKYS